MNQLCESQLLSSAAAGQGSIRTRGALEAVARKNCIWFDIDLIIDLILGCWGEAMSGDWRQPIARIWGSGGIVGTGCLVQTPQEGICLLTAAHVVNQALSQAGAERGSYFQAPPSPEERLVFDLPFRGGLARHAACVIQWYPPRPPKQSCDGSVEDVALLKVLDPDGATDYVRLPHDLHVFSIEEFEVLGLEELQRQSQVHAFGFSREEGAFAQGSLRGPDGAGRLHLVGDTAQGDFIGPGFSGAPVFMGRRIIGMAVAVDGKEDKRLAFLQSTFNLWRTCPELARPYRGLRTFEEEDAAFFFGRGAFIDQMLAKAEAFPILGVTAASGSGKSSAIRAGLIPKLRVEGRILSLLMRPASDPWKELALELCRLEDANVLRLALDDRADERARMLRESRDKLGAYARQLLEQHQADRLMIVVDQFEELFTLAGHDRQLVAGNEDPAAHPASDAESRRNPDFRDLMVASANLDTRHGPVIQWLFALRGDFADRAFRHRPFADRVGDGNMFLADMTTEELHGAVRDPATRLDVNFEGGTDREPGLAERIARDGGHTAGTLPLVQHLLEELWRGMKGRLLTHRAYDGLGKVEGALERHAERIYGGLSSQQKALLPRLFSRLIHVKEDGEAARRIARRSELGEERWALAERLAEEDARLLLLSAGAGTQKDAPDPIAEVGHEALLRHWSRLRDWVRGDQHFLLWRQGFEQRLKDHKEASDKAGTWLSGGILERAIAYLEERGDDLSSDEVEFIDGSRERRDAEELEKEKQRQDLENALATARAEKDRAEAATIHATTNGRKFMWAFVGAVGLAVAASGAFIIATNRAVEIRKQREQAEDDGARYAAAIARQLISKGDFVNALKVARPPIVKALRPDDVSRKHATLSAMQEAFAKLSERPGAMPGMGGFGSIATFSPDGKLLLTVSRNVRGIFQLGDESLHLWDVSTGRLMAALETNGWPPYAVTFSPDNTQAIAAFDSGRITIFNISDGKSRILNNLSVGPITFLSFSKNGYIIIFSPEDGVLKYIDASNYKTVKEINLYIAIGYNFGFLGRDLHYEFSQNQGIFVIATDDGGVIVVDLIKEKVILTINIRDEKIEKFFLSLNGKKLFVYTKVGSIYSIDIMSANISKEDEYVPLFYGPGLDSVAGKFFVLVHSGGEVHLQVRDANDMTLLKKFRWPEKFDPTSNRIIAISPDTRRIVVVGKNLQLLDLSSAGIREFYSLKTNELKSVVVSPDASRMLTIFPNGTARLWNTRGAALDWEYADGRKSDQLKDVYAASFSFDGDKLVTAGFGGLLRVWRSSDGHLLLNLSDDDESVTSVAFSQDGSYIVAGYHDGTARVWNAQNRDLLHTFDVARSPVWSVAFSPNKQWISTVSEDVKIWTGDGRFVRPLDGGGFATFSPDSTQIVTGMGDDGTADFSVAAYVWSVGDWRRLHVLVDGEPGQRDVIRFVRYSPDSKRIITTSSGYRVLIWDSESGQMIQTLVGAKGENISGAFSRDGCRIVTASKDGFAYIWDASTGLLLQKLGGDWGAIVAASFSVGDSELLTASERGLTQFWNVVPAAWRVLPSGDVQWTVQPPMGQALLDRVDQIVPQKLTEQERKEILQEKASRPGETGSEQHTPQLH